jgi:sRNA-binding regulator protein Hfq
MYWLAPMLLLTLAQPLEVTVEPLTGVQITGSVVELSGDRVVIETDGQQQAYASRDLLAVVASGHAVAASSAGSIWIELIDGSRLIATGYTVKDRVAEIQLSGRAVSLETRNIRSVRFHLPTEALDQQWREILGGRNRGDVIVLRRSDTALDQLEGVFHDVTDDTVVFEYDDERIDVKRTKLEGMVYYHAVSRELPEPLCVVQEVHGTTWRAKSVELRDGQLTIATPLGDTAVLAWDSVARLDFSTANVAYLSDLEFELTECTPYIASAVSADRLRQLFAPRRNSGFAGDGLYLADSGEAQRYEKGLAIHSRSELVFRLSEPYRKLTAVVGIDSRVNEQGNLVLVIDGDGQELYRGVIAGGDAPVTLDLDITSVRRLRILVDYGQSLDIADHLNLCNSRVIK